MCLSKNSFLFLSSFILPQLLERHDVTHFRCGHKLFGIYWSLHHSCLSTVSLLSLPRQPGHWKPQYIFLKKENKTRILKKGKKYISTIKLAQETFLCVRKASKYSAFSSTVFRPLQKQFKTVSKEPGYIT